MFARNYQNGLEDPVRIVQGLDKSLEYHGLTVDHVRDDIPTNDLLKAIGYWITQGLDVRGISFYRWIRLQLTLESFLLNFGGHPDVKAEVLKSQYQDGYFISATYEIDGIEFVTTADDTPQSRRLFGC